MSNLPSDRDEDSNLCALDLSPLSPHVLPLYLGGHTSLSPVTVITMFVFRSFEALFTPTNPVLNSKAYFLLLSSLCGSHTCALHLSYHCSSLFPSHTHLHNSHQEYISPIYYSPLLPSNASHTYAIVSRNISHLFIALHFSLPTHLIPMQL